MVLKKHIGLLAYASLAIACGIAIYVGGALRDKAQPAIRVVFLARGDPASDTYFQRFVQSFSSRHAELARDVRIEALSTPDDEEELASLLNRSKTKQPTIFVAQNGTQAQAARRGAPEVPLVFSSHADPREIGVVSNLLQHPEPATGLWITDDLDAKRLELLMDAYPSVQQVAVIGDQEWMDGLGPAQEAMRTLAKNRGVRLLILMAPSVDDALRLADSTSSQATQAWCLPRTSLTIDSRLAQRIASAGKVVMAGHTADIYGAAHLSYAPDKNFVAPALADLVARLLRHEQPNTIPVQLPQRFQLAVRIATDPRLPPLNSDFVRRADLVIR